MFGRLRRWRDRRVVEQRPIPEAMWRDTLARYPFIGCLVSEDAQRLREMSTLFLARKEFSGAQGLEVTDEMAVAIAVQACLPVMNLGLHWYDSFVGIVVHSSEVVAKRKVMDDDGVVHHYDEALTGEAMQGGPLMLSWNAVAEAGTFSADAYNVVVHEFAHILDMRNGLANGAPPLPNAADRARWQHVFSSAYQSFCDEVDAGQETWLDPYASEDPAEFFAVLCEAFFVSPIELKMRYAEIYALLQIFFKQDPGERTAA